MGDVINITKSIKQVKEILFEPQKKIQRVQQSQESPSVAATDEAKLPAALAANAVEKFAVPSLDLSGLRRAGKMAVPAPTPKVAASVPAPTPVAVATPAPKPVAPVVATPQPVERPTVKTAAVMDASAIAPALVFTKTEIEQIVLQYLREHAQSQPVEKSTEETAAHPALPNGE